MNPWAPFVVFLVLGTAWTAVWVWIVVRSRDVAVPYDQIAARGERIRARLLAAVGLVLLLVLIVSIRWLPYRVFAVARLGAPTVRVAVTATMWQWTMSRMQVPRDAVVDFAVTSDDVNHGFGIYSPAGQLVAQVQAMPGFTNHLVLRFSQPGQYLVRCLEYCGIPHIGMATAFEVR